MNRGLLFGVGAYLLWGFFPIYWKALHTVPSVELLAHRVLWSFILLAIVITWRKEWATLKRVFSAPAGLLVFVLAAGLLAVNWLTYIWGVNAGFVVETSLGYFINPLVNVVLGVVFLRERLRSFQWIPVALAAAGVLYLTLSVGSLPWIALVLAFTFGLYGLVKKTARLEALHSQTLEMVLLILPALGYLLYLESKGVSAFGHSPMSINGLLVGAGLVTAVPLLLFGIAARRINLSTLGILQYIAPTCQFLLGVLAYNEPFTPSRIIGFSLIWIALMLYTVEGLIFRRKASLSLA